MAPSSSIDLRPKRDADDDRVGDTDVVKTCLKRRKEGFFKWLHLPSFSCQAYLCLFDEFFFVYPVFPVFLLNSELRKRKHIEKRREIWKFFYRHNCWHWWWFLSKRPVRAAFISWWLLLWVSPMSIMSMASCLLCCTIARVAMRANVLASISQLNLWFISHRSLFGWHASSSFHSSVALDIEEAIWKQRNTL